MAIVNLILFHWGEKYEIGYVKKLVAGINRSLHAPHRIFVCTDKTNSVGYRGLGVTLVPIWDRGLTEVKGCFARLRLFDPAWQKWIGAQEGERLVSIDLDAIVVDDLDSVLNYSDEPFVILQGANSSNPCLYNGSLFALRAGHRPDVWSSFSLEAARKVPFFEFPDDQAWFEAKMPDAAGWQAGKSGVYAFQKPGWPQGEALPADASLVVFPGWRDPSKFSHLPWVQEHWKE